MSDIADNYIDLSDRQRRALPYLAAAPNIQDGCRQAKIRTDTYYRWIKQPAFVNALKKQRDTFVDEAMRKLKANVVRAVDALVALLNTENDSLKRQTANDIIGYVIKLREMTDIEDRLDSIEKTLSEMKGGKS